MAGHYFKMLFFSVLVLLAFMWLSYSIPQKVSLPPEHAVFDASKIKTKADVVKVGQKIFFGKGQCALCHSIGPSEAARCPNLEGVGGKLTRDFIYESLTHPQAYIFKDYRQTPPKVFPATMPHINKPPVDLSEAELLAVVSFAQSLGGEVTVRPEEFLALMPKTGIEGDPEAGKQVYARMDCNGCHQSDLATLLEGKDALRLQDLIVEPVASKRDPTIHKDFDRKLSVKDLKDLTVYLTTLKKD
jgi:mono/diheme cytochrome c family protein